MKYIKRVFLVLFLLLTSINVFAYGNEIEAFYYDSINVDIEIKEKGVLEVTETRNTVFNQSRRGIYFNLSENFILNFSGEEIKRKFNIYDVNVLSGHSYKVTRNSSGTINIRLGNPNYYANTNESYVINYKILTKDLGLDSEILYYNLLGRESTITKKLTFKITSYKDTDFSKLKFYKGNNNIEFKNVKTTITSNSIEGEVLEEFSQYEPFTTIITFDKGYYGYPSLKSISGSMIFIIIAGFVLAILFLVHNTKGKDEEIIEQITMKIPEGLNSADIAYLYENNTSQRAVMSLLFQLANEKYIKIEAEKKKFLITKLKEYDGNDQAKDKVMKMIFYNNQNQIDLANSNTTLGKELYYGFSSIAIITENKFQKEKKLYNHNYGLLVLFSLIISLLQITYLIFATYSVSNSLFFSNDWSLYLIIFIYNILLVFILEKSYLTLKGKTNSKFGFIFTVFISGIVYLYLIYYMQKSVLSISIFDILFTVICVIISLLIPYLGQRTEYGNKLLGKVKGLHTFITYTKEDKLKMYLDQNPNLFFDILPVAFAFGLTKKWLNLFKNYNIEEMNNSYLYNYSTINYLSNYNNDISSIMPSYNEYKSEISRSSSSGGSSGYSGFGGGGFGGSTSSGSW